METSLRFSGDSKSLRIHAKEKYPIDSNTHLQVRGELDTKWGALSFFDATLRHFFPDISASLGLAVLYERHGLALQHRKQGMIQYGVRGKKAFPVTANGLMYFNIKGRSDVDKEFKEDVRPHLRSHQWKSKVAAEFSWSILNFLPEQDVRIKLGYEVVEKVPYLQIRENNWTFNADMSGRWNIRYSL
ncbi:Outer envelope pore protein 21, chloroplastic-like protein [Drosera capensis]